jgi:hypothetical protein
MKLLCAFIFACLSLQARTDRPAITSWSVEYNEHSTLAEYTAGTSYVEDTIYVAALSAPPITAPVASNEHSSLLEYVGATSYVEDTTYTASLAAPVHRPFQGYWMDDPIMTVAVIDEYNVGPIAPVRQASAPIRPKPARTVRGIPVDHDTTAAIAAAMQRSEDDSFGPGGGFVIERGWGFRVPDTIVHHVQAKDWW